jgi:hypothetical protein
MKRRPLLTNCFLLLGVLLALSILSQNAFAQIYVIGSDAQFGTIDPLTGVINVIGTTNTDLGKTIFSGLAWTPNSNLFYSVRGDAGLDNGLYSINPTNAATTFQKNIGVPLVTITSRLDGVLFGYSANMGMGTLWRINPLTETMATQVGAAGALGTVGAGGLVFGGNGNLYLADDATGQLHQVDTTTGVTTPVGAGMGAFGLYGMAADSNGNTYGFLGDDRGVYSINLSTGAATQGTQYTFGPASPLDLIYGATAVIPEPATGCLMLLGSIVAPYLLVRRTSARQ